LDVVKWTIYAMLEAEEMGLTSKNIVNKAAVDTDPAVQRFVGNDGSLGEGLGLPADFAKQIIAQVGNYGELYERNISPIELPRGVNNLWTNGGLMYAMPLR